MSKILTQPEAKPHGAVVGINWDTMQALKADKARMDLLAGLECGIGHMEYGDYRWTAGSIGVDDIRTVCDRIIRDMGRRSGV